MSKRIYKGRITKLVQTGTTAFGIRAYDVHFETGSAIFQISNKKTLPISLGQFIYFTGEFYGDYYVIDEVYNESEMKLYCGKPSGVDFVEDFEGERIYKAEFKDGLIYCTLDTMLSPGKYQKFTVKKKNGIMFVNQIMDEIVPDGYDYGAKHRLAKKRTADRLEREAMEDAINDANAQVNKYVTA